MNLDSETNLESLEVEALKFESTGDGGDIFVGCLSELTVDKWLKILEMFIDL